MGVSHQGLGTGRLDPAWWEGQIRKPGRAGHGYGRGQYAKLFPCTDRDYADFDLQLEFWVDDGLNSGVQIRSASRPDYREGAVHGYQVEIDPSPRSWSAGIYDESRAGWLFTLEDNAEAREAFKHETWNTLRVVASGKQIRTWLNGVEAANFQKADVPSGFIALQVHSVPDDKAGKQVRWRNIRIRELASDADSASTAPSEELVK